MDNLKINGRRLKVMSDGLREKLESSSQDDMSTHLILNIPSNSFCCLEHVEQTSFLAACAPQCRMKWFNNFQVLDTDIHSET